MLIKRSAYLTKIDILFKIHPIVALLGPRQSGKTTLAKEFQKSFAVDNAYYFDLEDPVDLERLGNPQLALKYLSGLIIIDEIQRLPNLFPFLRSLVDQEKNNKKFLILGSASRDLIKQSSETLAGRIAYIEVHPFSIQEIDDLKNLHLRGGFPKAYMAENDELAFVWLEHYIRTFLERDIPSLGFSIPATTMRRFWSMLVHYHGNIFNSSELGRSLGVSDHTIRSYLDILTGTFMIRQLLPWYENINKRQVKRPKIYFRDSGILHKLMNTTTWGALYQHPRIGASWEGFALEQVVRYLQIPEEQCYFWAIHNQGELDLLVFHNNQKLGFEFKYTDAPKLSSSMIKALDLLQLGSLFVIYPGDKAYLLADNIKVLPLSQIETL